MDAGEDVFAILAEADDFGRGLALGAGCTMGPEKDGFGDLR
jgi:hypothetical protein